MKAFIITMKIGNCKSAFASAKTGACTMQD